MEDTLRGVSVLVVLFVLMGLNPCFNGRYSQRTINFMKKKIIKCLNPCFNGRYSQSLQYFKSIGITDRG